MGQMFNYCPKLTTICCMSDWSGTTAKSDFMFSNCTSLVGGMGTVFDNNFRDATYARPDGGTASPGYFTAETLTSVKAIDDGQLTVDNEGSWYSLDGRKLGSKPAKAGLYINGGKKVVLQ